MTAIVESVKGVARRVGIRRSSLAALRTQAEREFLATAGKRHRAATGRILCYHSVGTEEWGVNDVSRDRFAQHIEVALKLGYRFVPAARIAAGLASAWDVAITFDDGLTSVATNAAPILAAYGIPATLFVVTDWAEGRHGFGHSVMLDWSGIKKLAAGGIEVGSHSVSHPDFGDIEPKAAYHELVESRRVIEQRIGIRVTSFAIPWGQSSNWTTASHRAAVEAGYVLIYAQSAMRRPPGTVSRTFITRYDDRRLFAAALEGAFDDWEEWM